MPSGTTYRSLSSTFTLARMPYILLGQKVELQRFLLIVLAALLAGTAVSVAGLIGFVGLVVPHAIRIFIGEDYLQKLL